MGLSDHPYIVHPSQSRQIALSVSDVERLAKAGVAVALDGNIVPMPDPVPQHADGNGYRGGINTPESLVQPLIERLERAKAVGAGMGWRDPPVLADTHIFRAVVHDDKVYVFCYNGRTEPVILTDESNLYPSDKLVAAVHLFLSEKAR